VLKVSFHFGPPEHRYLPTFPESNSTLLFGTQAIHIQTTKQSAVYALPWTSRLSSRDDVMNFCREIFTWYEERVAGAAASCPGQVLCSVSQRSWLFTNTECLQEDKLLEPLVYFLGSSLPQIRWVDLGDFFN
jgi:hypothetical protein